MNVKIIVACHKPDFYKNDSVYMPIQVGKANSKYDLGIQGDDTGDNISFDNPYFCELSGLYWAWKNLKNVDVIGLCHYRRYFDFNNKLASHIDTIQKTVSEFEKIDVGLSDKMIKEIFFKNAVVVAKEAVFHSSNFDIYSIFHSSIDLRNLENIIKNNCEKKYYDSFVKIMHHSNKFSPFNMFLMRWEDFCQYCSWLFPLLDKLRKITNIDNYDDYQKRIYGYLTERLLNVWLMANDKRCIKKTVIQVLPDNSSCNSILKTMYNRMVCNVSYKVNLLQYDSLKSFFINGNQI